VSTQKETVLYLGPGEGLETVSEVLRKTTHLVSCPADESNLIAAVPSAVAIIDASMRVRINESILKHAKILKLISTATTGSDHIEIEALKQRGIVLRTLKEDKALIWNLTPAAELTWALIMGLVRKLVPASRSVQSGRWEREEFGGFLLNKKTLGLVGCGRIGQHIARYGQAFGMEVIGFDPYLREWPSTIRSVELPDLMSMSDIVSIHVHLTEETDGLIDRELLGKMPRGSFLINTSRAKVVDESALLDLLHKNHFGGVGLDVLTDEPEIENHPLVDFARSNDKLIITPHCGGYSPDAVRIVCRRAAEKVLDLLQENCNR